MKKNWRKKNKQLTLRKTKPPSLKTVRSAHERPKPPDNNKMIDKRRKPTKPRAKRANSGIKGHITEKQAAKP